MECVGPADLIASISILHQRLQREAFIRTPWPAKGEPPGDEVEPGAYASDQATTAHATEKLTLLRTSQP